MWPSKRAWIGPVRKPTLAGASRRREQRGQPGGGDLDVVVEEEEPLDLPGRGDPDVAGPVDPAGRAVEHRRSGELSHRTSRRVRRVRVVDDEDGHPGGARLRHDAFQGHAEVARPPPGGNDDRRSQAPESRFAADRRASCARSARL